MYNKEWLKNTKIWLRNNQNIIENPLRSTKKGAALCPRILVTQNHLKVVHRPLGHCICHSVRSPGQQDYCIWSKYPKIPPHFVESPHLLAITWGHFTFEDICIKPYNHELDGPWSVKNAVKTLGIPQIMSPMKTHIPSTSLDLWVVPMCSIIIIDDVLASQRCSQCVKMRI